MAKDKEWFTNLTGNNQGRPLTSAELKALASQGELLPEDLIWCKGLPDWVAARKVKGLFNLVGDKPFQANDMLAEPLPGDRYFASKPVPPPTARMTSSEATKDCPFCGEEIRTKAIKCKHCGEFFDEANRPPTFTATAQASQPPTVQVVVQGSGSTYGHGSVMTGRNSFPPNLVGAGQGKNKISAALLAFFLGGLGAHKFYLGGWFWGLVYLFFCLTFIPSIIALVEGVVYLTMSNETFDSKYNHNEITAFSWC